MLHPGKHSGHGISDMLSHLFDVVPRLQSGTVAPEEDAARKQIEVVMLRRISGTPEHVQHLLSHQETTWLNRQGKLVHSYLKDQ